MTSKSPEQWAGCPIRFTLSLFGDQWRSLLIIRDLMFKGRRYYGEFLEASEGVSTNVLTDRLERLGSAGIIEKLRDLENRKRG